MTSWSIYPDTVLSLNGHRVVLSAYVDPVRRVLLGDLEEVNGIVLCASRNSREPGDDGRPQTVADGAAPPDSDEQRSQTRPGSGNDGFFEHNPPTVDDPNTTDQTAASTTAKERLAEAHIVFRKWLSEDYDVAVLNAVLATAASSSLGGDPLWLLVIGGAGNAKTETVSALSGAGAVVTSTIASEGALLSATAAKERSKSATGGLLRSLGKRSILVLKDFTTILSMSDRNSRSTVLAALREVYDGYWARNVGSDGGQTLVWKGHLTLIGACTTAWDSAHAVVSSMGDRFVLIRSDSSNTRTRLTAGRQAIQNTGHESEMRRELSKSVANVIESIKPAAKVEIGGDEQEAILAVANLVTLARTSIEYDYRGKLIRVHAPEAPTRFAKELTQMARGALVIGLDSAETLELVYRCARDSMPPLRLRCLLDVARNAGTGTNEVTRRIQVPWSAVDRELQALLGLRLLKCDAKHEDAPSKKRSATKWFYTLADDVDRSALDKLGR